MESLSDILDDTTSFEKVATGFVFTEGPLWHPDGFFYFVDVRANGLFRVTPGKPHEKVRETHGGNGLSTEFGLLPLWGISRLLRIAPVSAEMVLNYVAQHSLGLPRSY